MCFISGDIASYRFSTLAMVPPRRRAGCGRSLPSNGRRYAWKAAVTSLPEGAMNASAITLVLPPTLASFHEGVIDGVIADSPDHHRAVARPPDRLLYGEFADFARLPPIHVRGAAGEEALKIAERIATHALDA